MAVDVNNITMGILGVKIDGTDIGALAGEVKFNFAISEYDVKCSQLQGLLDVIPFDWVGDFDLSIQELSLANIKRQMKQSASVTSNTLYIGDPSNTVHKVDILGVALGTHIGLSATIYKASPPAGATLTWAKDKAYDINGKWKILRDTGKAADKCVAEIHKI